MSSIALIGKPNSGKSLLFNKLTGLSQKVANFPGITVEVKSGKFFDHTVLDFPGIYTFSALTTDEKVAVEKFSEKVKNNSIDGIVCVLDATHLTASLRIGLEILKFAQQSGRPVIFALNMYDVLKTNNIKIDYQALAIELDSEVIPLSARTGYGINLLEQVIHKCSHLKISRKKIDDPQKLATELNKKFGFDNTLLIKQQSRLDDFFLNHYLGGIAFAFIMILLFQSIFTFAVPFMDFVETIINLLAHHLAPVFPEGMIRDFFVDAVFGGVGSFIVFVPQIFFLTFIVGLLEDSGYLARAAIICHKPLQYFGLSGKSFIPLLSGHACAIPAILATRNIESPKRRLLTMIIVPLMGCSARLPVYALLTAAFIPPVTYFGGLIGLQGLLFFSLYAFAIIVALAVAAFLSKTALKNQSDTPFILELPSYRMPHFGPLIKKSLTSCWHFITKAGVVILMVTIVVWVLGYFPGGAGQLQTSGLAYMGRFIEPLLAPLGLDWKYGIAILTSFLAREVFVGTLGTLFGIEGADENIVGLASNIQASGLPISSGVALLVFYAIALQCASTLAIIRKELGSYKIPVLLFFGYGSLAYLLAFVAKMVLKYFYDL